MTAGTTASRESGFELLRRLARSPVRTESCEFCGSTVPCPHRHLLETATRRIVCTCDPCALRFENVIGRWKLIPRDPRVLENFQMTDAEWEAFALPINLAFCFQSTPVEKVVAMYPSPAGATESLLPLPSWQALVGANPPLAAMLPDVEGLLINRLGKARAYFIAPIDVCFELVGLIRLHWRGLSGGEKLWGEIAAFFENLKQRSGHSGRRLLEEEPVHA